MIEVHNIFGQLVYSKINNEVTTSFQEIDLFDFQNGIYNLSVKVDNRLLPTKLFVITK